MPQYIQKFVDSYARIGAKDPQSGAFFDAFYESFIAASPEVAEKFVNTDMPRQKEMLRMSLDHMVYFAIDRQETAEMTRVADVHSRSKADISPQLYDLWLESLLSIVSRFDPEYSESVELAWRQALQPGIEYMRSRHSIR